MTVVVNGPIHIRYEVIFRSSLQLESSDATEGVHNINQYLSIRSGFNTIPIQCQLDSFRIGWYGY